MGVMEKARLILTLAMDGQSLSRKGPAANQLMGFSGGNCRDLPGHARLKIERGCVGRGIGTASLAGGHPDPSGAARGPEVSGTGRQRPTKSELLNAELSCGLLVLE